MAWFPGVGTRPRFSLHLQFIAAAIMLGMLALLRETTNQVPLYLQEREAWATSFQAIVTPILIAIGGAFALYKFVFEGAFSQRLQPSASVVVIRDGEKRYVRISATAQYIGKRRVRIDPDFTRLSIRFTARQGEVGHSQLRTQYSNTSMSNRERQLQTKRSEK
jgi:hypothetical protein